MSGGTEGQPRGGGGGGGFYLSLLTRESLDVGRTAPIAPVLSGFLAAKSPARNTPFSSTRSTRILFVVICGEVSAGLWQPESAGDKTSRGCQTDGVPGDNGGPTQISVPGAG